MSGKNRCRDVWGQPVVGVVVTVVPSSVEVVEVWVVEVGVGAPGVEVTGDVVVRVG